MKNGKRTTREKLELMKEIDRRNAQRDQEYAKQERERKLLDLYLTGQITKEELDKKIKE